MSRRSAVLSGVAILAVLALGISNASAASLSVFAGKLGTFAATHPCPGTATATVATPVGSTYSAVSVTVPSGCSGRRLDLTLLNGSTALQNGTATVASSGATTVTFAGTYTATPFLTVQAVVAGWNLPTTWAYTPPVVGLTATCSTTKSNATCAADVVLRDYWAGGYNLDVTVRDTRTIGNANQYAWTVVINFSSAGYPFVPNAIDGSGVVTASTCGQRPTLTFTGVTNWGTHHLLGTGETRTFWLQPKSSGTGTILTCP